MSGIYIPGMEMPCACVFCELYDGDNYWCNAAKKDVHYSQEDKRARFCPLIRVPEHGRLIDADALAHLIEEKEKEWGNEYLSLDDKSTDMALVLQSWAGALQYVKHLVINFPSSWGDP